MRESDGQSSLVYVAGSLVNYDLMSDQSFHWAVLTIRDVDGRSAKLYTPNYEDEATARKHCETAMVHGEVLAIGYWYQSGAGKVFLVKEWSSFKEL